MKANLGLNKRSTRSRNARARTPRSVNIAGKLSRRKTITDVARVRKNGKNKPTIVRRVSKEDKLIKDYLEVYEAFRRF